MSSIIAAGALTFVAGFLFYESDPVRAAVFDHSKKIISKASLRLAAFGFLVLGLLLAISVSGLARGIPIWIGMLMVFGLGSVLIANWRQSIHKTAGISAAAIAATAFLAMGIGLN